MDDVKKKKRSQRCPRVCWVVWWQKTSEVLSRKRRSRKVGSGLLCRVGGVVVVRESDTTTTLEAACPFGSGAVKFSGTTHMPQIWFVGSCASATVVAISGEQLIYAVEMMMMYDIYILVYLCTSYIYTDISITIYISCYLSLSISPSISSSHSLRIDSLLLPPPLPTHHSIASSPHHHLVFVTPFLYEDLGGAAHHPSPLRIGPGGGITQ